MAIVPYSDTFWFPSGALAVNVPARVFDLNGPTLVPLWADLAGTIPLPNPLDTNGAGVLSFFIEEGTYWIHIDSETFEVEIPTPAPGPYLPLAGGALTGPVTLTTGAFSASISTAFGTTLSTGVISGGHMSGLGTSTVTFQPMTGYIVDADTNPTNPSVQFVSMPLTVHPLAGAELTRTVNWWLCDAAGVVTAQATRPTEVERRNRIQLGVTGSTVGPGVLFNVETTPVVLRQPTEQLNDLMYALGPFSVDGNTVSANGVNLMINKSVGTVFAPNFAYAATPKSPHMRVSPAETPITFRNSTRVSGSQGPLTTLVNPTVYDVGGVVTPVPGGANTSTVQRVWLFGTGIAGAQIALQYGQVFFPSLSAAIAAIGSGIFVPNPDYAGIAVLIGYIAMIKSATNLSDPAQATFVKAAKFAVP